MKFKIEVNKQIIEIICEKRDLRKILTNINGRVIK